MLVFLINFILKKGNHLSIRNNTNEGRNKMLKRMIIKQQDEKDCAICCIKSILIYYDGYAPLEKIRQDTFTSKKGTSAFHIVECLKDYGFDAYGVTIKKENFFNEKFPLPAIVHVVLDNGLNHYMVLYEIRKEKVILMDPATGKKTMGISDLFWIWSEVAIITYPKTEIINCPKESNTLSLFLAYLGKFHKEYLQMIGINIFSYFMIILGSYFLKFQIEFLNRPTEQLIFFIIFTIILILKILSIKSSYQMEQNLNKNLEVIHVSTFFNHLCNIPLKQFKSRDYSDYFTRLWEQFDIKYQHTEIIKNYVLSLNTVLFCFLLLYFINKHFFYIIMGISFIDITGLIFFQKKLETQERMYREEKNRFSNISFHFLQSLETFTYLNIRKKQERQMETKLISFLRKKEIHEKLLKSYLFYQNTIKEISNFIIISIAILLITRKELLLVDFLLIETIKNYIINGLEEIIKNYPKYYYLKEIMRKSHEFLHTEEENLKKGNTTFVPGDLELDNVTFTYDQYHYIFKDLKMKIKEGNHILLLGASGSGKSTLCKILTKNLNLTYGEIKIGNLNIEDYNLLTIRDNIVYLPQKSPLISGTIKENILLSCENNFQLFQEICKICHIEEIVKKRPLRYETRINSQENDLSGGEKQRIVLARTLMRKANIFLLDECLSEVDEKLEKDIIKNMRIFLKGKILVYISHKNHKKLFDETYTLESCHERVLIS